MHRREFITLIGSAAATWPFAARAQQSERIWRIGILMSVKQGDQAGLNWLSAFRKHLQNFGWLENKNTVLKDRWAAGDTKRAQTFARELVTWNSDVILANSTIATEALKNETRTIPIVFTNLTDPVGQGFVVSLARPGGNITGFSNYEPLITTKWLETLREIAPNATRILVVFNPETTPKQLLGSIDAASKSFSLTVTLSPVHDESGLQSAINSLGKESGGGLLIMPGGFTAAHRDLIVALTAKNRIPAIYAFSYWVHHGGLVSYGVDVTDLFSRAAIYVDRILKGARPSDLPVQEPTKFELAINLKAAKALGLTVPPSMLTRADEVIE